MAVPQALSVAGLVAERKDSNKRLIVRDIDPDGDPKRTRGGHALASLLNTERSISALDIRDSKIADNGVAAICLVIRQTDQLEELCLSPVGHAGLEFVLGVVRRCYRLRSLRITVCDVPTLEQGRTRLEPSDYDNSGYVRKKVEGQEEENEEDAPDDDDEEDKEKKELEKMEKLRKIFAENDRNSDDEREGKKPGVQASYGASPVLNRLLLELLEAVKKNANLTFVDCKGDAVTEELSLDLERSVEEHRSAQQKELQKREAKGSRTAYDALKDQMEELRAGVVSEEDCQDPAAALGLASGSEEPQESRLGIRSYVGRRLFSALGEALFECQRFKSKENQAVSTAEGEMAFIAMYLRKQKEANLEKLVKKKSTLVPQT